MKERKKKGLKLISQKKKKKKVLFKLDFWTFPSVKSIHNSINQWLVMLNSNIKAKKGPSQKKIDLRMFCVKLPLWFTISSES